MDAPRKLACPSCGAAFPAGARPGTAAKCEHCGTTSLIPDSFESGGINLVARGGIFIGGDLVAGNKIVMGKRGEPLDRRDAPIAPEAAPRGAGPDKPPEAQARQRMLDKIKR